MSISLFVICPYCGLENILRLNIDSNYITKQIVTCEIEMGGCDKDFVIYPYIEVNAKVYKIEGI